ACAAPTAGAGSRPHCSRTRCERSPPTVCRRQSSTSTPPTPPARPGCTPAWATPRTTVRPCTPSSSDPPARTRSTMTAETPLAPIAERAAAPATLALPTAGGLSWRPATRDDVPAWLLLRHHVARADAEPYLATLEELEELFDADWRDMSADSLLGFSTSPADDGAPSPGTLEAPGLLSDADWSDMSAVSLLGFSTSPADDGALVAWAHVEAPPGDVSQVRAFTWGGVHPDHRGRGIGRELLAWEIGRARQLLAASGKDVPGRIAVFAEDDAPAATLHLYERAGMTPRRYYSDLARPLTGPDAAPVPEVELTGSLRLVPWAPELDEATRLAHNDA